MRNPALFERLFNTPHMIHPAKLDAIIAGLGPRFGLDMQSTNIVVGPDLSLVSRVTQSDQGSLISGDVAVINVMGVLAHRGGFQADSSYILGYESVSKQLDRALNDSAVKSIMLVLDTPGGEVAGAFELAQLIYDARGVKPIKAAVSSMAASAGYLIASAASEIVITDTGIAGSIGVVMRHADISQAAKTAGIDITYIYAGAQKIDGNQFAALTPDVKARFQAEIDNLYTLFVNTVSRYRGITVDAVRGQEAGIFTGQAAITAALADRLATPDQLLAEMQKSANYSPRGTSMTTPTKPEDAAAMEQSRAAGFEAGKQEGMTAGAAAERARIGGIINHEHAPGREAQAKVLALETNMTVEQAGKVLAVSPVTAAAPAANQNEFAKAMAGVKNPNVGAGDDEETEQPAGQAAAQGWGKAFAKVVPINGARK